MTAGRHVCRICAYAARVDPHSAPAEAAFRARLAELGATLLEPEWLGAVRPHRVRCVAGHECSPRPNGVQQGEGICRTCAGKDPRVSEATFRARLAELEATMLEPVWLGVSTPHRVRCAAGHECTPRPGNVIRGLGICLTCAGRDPRVAEAAFRARLAELEATMLEPVWLGTDTPHRVRCAAGHEGRPRPGGVARGEGICRVCAGRVWDVFYVVATDPLAQIKFGITSGDPRPRLRRHKADGYSQRILVLEGLPGTAAPEIEVAAIAALKLADIEPLHGREYYTADALAIVLDIADNYPHQDQDCGLGRSVSRDGARI